MKRCNKKSKLEKKMENKIFILNTNFLVSNKKGKYIPFCDLDYHRGLVNNDRICQKRHCKHYYPLYIRK